MSSAAFLEALELCVELDISGGVRLEMLSDPERAAAVLRHAKSARGIHNRAGFATANWRTGFDPRDSTPRSPEPELDEGPPTLSALEYAWSLPPSQWSGLLLRAVANALVRAGGFRELQRTFHELDLYGAEGEVISRSPNPYSEGMLDQKLQDIALESRSQE